MALDMWAASIGIENVLNQMPMALGTESFEMRKELLFWIQKNVDMMSRADYKSFIIPLLNCLMSK
jgi:hypothetical protein